MPKSWGESRQIKKRCMIKDLIKEHGFKAISVILFAIIIALYLCMKGILPIDKTEWLSWTGIKCSCGETSEARIHADSIIIIQKEIQILKDSVSIKEEKLKRLEETIATINENLASEQNATNSLIEQREELTHQKDNLKSELSELKKQLEERENLIKSMQDKIDSTANVNRGLDSLNRNIKQKAKTDSTEIDSLRQINDILNNVYINSIYVVRIDNSQIRVDYELMGVAILKKYGYSEKNPPGIKLKVIDLDKDIPIEHLEKKGESRVVAQSVFNFNSLSKDPTPGSINFVNTEQKPFEKLDRFRFELYLENFNRPFGTQQQNLKKKPQVVRKK